MTDNEIIKAFDNLLSRKWVVAKSGDELITMGDVADLINRQKREIDYWKRNAYDGCMERGRIEKSAKAEAIKEFAERVRLLNQENLIIWNEQIDNLVKEMVGDGDG